MYFTTETGGPSRPDECSGFHHEEEENPTKERQFREGHEQYARQENHALNRYESRLVLLEHDLTY